jgi:hypothetical protein
MNKRIQSIFYIIMTSLAAFQYISNGDMMQCLANLGIAFIFDPFDSKIAWKDRKVWQKSVLIIHVGLVIVLFFAANMPDIFRGISDGWNGR